MRSAIISSTFGVMPWLMLLCVAQAHGACLLQEPACTGTYDASSTYIPVDKTAYDGVTPTFAATITLNNTFSFNVCQAANVPVDSRPASPDDVKNGNAYTKMDIKKCADKYACQTDTALRVGSPTSQFDRADILTTTTSSQQTEGSTIGFQYGGDTVYGKVKASYQNSTSTTNGTSYTTTVIVNKYKWTVRRDKPARRRGCKSPRLKV